MASPIVAIEFDQYAFPTEVKCERWMRDKPEFQSLIQSKKWKLKTISKSIFMSSEGRKVFAWHGPIYQSKDLHLEHPEPHVVVITRGSSSFFFDSDLPPLSQRTQQKLRAAEAKLEQKDRIRMERKERARLKKRNRPYTKKSGKTVFDPKDAQPIKRRKAIRPKKSTSSSEEIGETILLPEKDLEEITDLAPSTEPTLLVSSDFSTRVDACSS